MKRLQAYGILYIKRADGTFVSENYNQKMLDPMQHHPCRRTAGGNLWNCAPSSISVR